MFVLYIYFMGITSRWVKKAQRFLTANKDEEIPTDINKEYSHGDKLLCIINLRSGINLMGILVFVDIFYGFRNGIEYVSGGANVTNPAFAWTFMGLKIILIYPVLLYIRFWTKDTFETRQNL